MMVQLVQPMYGRLIIQISTTSSASLAADAIIEDASARMSMGMGKGPEHSLLSVWVSDEHICACADAQGTPTNSKYA